MKIKKAFLLSLVLFLVGVTGFSPSVLATTGAGGQVNSKGQITFYEGSLESSTNESSATESSTVESSIAESSESSTAEVSSSSYPTTTTKPQGGGTYPSTGEVIQKYGIAGFGILLLVLFVFFSRRKKEEQG